MFTATAKFADIKLVLLPCRHCRLDSSSTLEDRHNFAGKRHVVSWLSWLDFCDQLISNANPIISRALAHHVRRHLLDERIEPAVMQTYLSLLPLLPHTRVNVTENNFAAMSLDYAACWDC